MTNCADIRKISLNDNRCVKDQLCYEGVLFNSAAFVMDLVLNKDEMDNRDYLDALSDSFYETVEQVVKTNNVSVPHGYHTDFSIELDEFLCMLAELEDDHITLVAVLTYDRFANYYVEFRTCNGEDVLLSAKINIRNRPLEW
ncbi:hypothetical protein [Ruminococcus sp.]|uniref:hypothetical protein n=1 Tax=Ruminococcus sp. TaxID=41978 RepID=UPI001B6C92A5|nr:hypothetical protein [Ruminococcus sp.]MBP5433683.1 hypothetical protein [Ruminococcus sp.]